MFDNNEHLFHSATSTYGEIEYDGVEKMIRGIQENFLHYLDDEQELDFRVLDVGGGLMTTMIHFAQKIKGYYCGIKLRPVRSKLFVNSFKQVLEKKLLINQNIAYLWKDVREFSIFDFDLVYTFDECFSNQDWKHMMNIFNISPGFEFLISFRYTKPKKVTKRERDDMIEEYNLVMLDKKKHVHEMQ